MDSRQYLLTLGLLCYVLRANLGTHPMTPRRVLILVAAGDAQLEPSVQRRLLDAFATGAPVAVAGPPADGLTARETELLRVVAEGPSNTEVAARLHVSEATVKTHVSHLLAKTGSRDRAALVAYAFRTGRGGR